MIPALTLAVVLAMPPVQAPPRRAAEARRRGALVVGRAFTGDGSGPAWSFDGAFRLRERLWVQVGVFTSVLEMGEYPACPPGLFCVAIVGGNLELTGDAIAVEGGVLAEIPSPARRLRPFVTAGAGVASVRRELRHLTFNTRSFKTTNEPIVYLGAGADVLMGKGFGIGLDARYERVFGDEPFGREDIPSSIGWTRVGIALTYRR